ncbi:hypothetical protein ACFFUZ_25535, partial [Kibdelosporangium philippinense]
MFTVEPVTDVVTGLAPWPVTAVLGSPFGPDGTWGPSIPGSPPVWPVSELITLLWAGPFCAGPFPSPPLTPPLGPPFTPLPGPPFTPLPGPPLTPLPPTAGPGPPWPDDTAAGPPVEPGPPLPDKFVGPLTGP